MNKKIICLIESLGSGGAERQMSGLAVLLKQQGYDVEVWTYYPNDFYLPTLQSAGVKYRYISKAQARDKRIVVLHRELKKANPETVIAYLDQSCIVACIIKLLGAKFRLIVSERNTTQKLTFRDRLKFFLYRFADYVVPNSHTQTDFIAKHFASLRKKLRCITNFVDTDKFCSLEVKRINDPIRILTVARIMPQKNIINYIKAVRMAVDKGCEFRVDWYGQATDTEYYELCLQAVRDNHLEDVLHFHKPERDIVKCYQRADLFCLPSIYEGYPNVVCEAMSCGLPILCSNVCDNPMIVEQGVNGYMFNPLDVAQISETIKRFVDLTNNDRLSMGYSSRHRAINLFSSTAFVEKYMRLIML